MLNALKVKVVVLTASARQIDHNGADGETGGEQVMAAPNFIQANVNSVLQVSFHVHNLQGELFSLSVRQRCVNRNITSKMHC